MIAPGRATKRRTDGAAQGQIRQIDELGTAAGTLVAHRTEGSAAVSARVVRGRGAEVTGGLTRRMVIASGLLALLISSAFVVLLVSERPAWASGVDAGVRAATPGSEVRLGTGSGDPPDT